MQKQAGNILLSTDKLSIGYKHQGRERHVVLQDLSLQIKRGQLISLIGPNGAGKSTLIKSLIGFQSSLSGTIEISNEKLESIDAVRLSQLMGVVLTEPVFEQSLNVFALVALGRYQYTNWFGRLKDTDNQKVLEAIKNVGLTHKISTRLSELSDGEKQRALIARVLAQDVDLIILDEPTAHLDLPNRMDILLLLKQLSHQYGKGILLSTHELGLAMQVSDEVWLINKEGSLIQEIPEVLIQQGELDKAFGNSHIAFQPESASFEIKPFLQQTAGVEGDGSLAQCVRRMLKRHGFQLCTPTGKNTYEISILKDEIINLKFGDEMHRLMNLDELNMLIENINKKENFYGV